MHLCLSGNTFGFCLAEKDWKFPTLVKFSFDSKLGLAMLHCTYLEVYTAYYQLAWGPLGCKKIHYLPLIHNHNWHALQDAADSSRNWSPLWNIHNMKQNTLVTYTLQPGPLFGN